MARSLSRVVFVAALLGAATIASEAAAAGAFDAVRVKPPEMSIPPGTKFGALRRIIQPFGPWTLICDEDLHSRKRVCNVSQTVVDASGKTVFSWSLAASEGGAPVFILRLPAALATDHFIQVLFGRQKDPTTAGVILSSCDAATCLGFLPVDAKIQHQIAGHVDVVLRVRVGSSVQSFGASLDGLGQAVASLK